MSTASHFIQNDTENSLAEIASLADMKSEHRRILEKNHGDTSDPAIRAEILHFIHKGSALGARLSALDDRVEAQRMLDYWGAIANSGVKSGALVSAGSDSELVQGSSESTIVPAVLTNYKDAGEIDAAGKADALFKGASESARTLLKRLFLGLIALEENGTSFRLTSHTASELTEKLAAPAGETQPHEWLARLVETGIVRKHDDGTYSLVGPSVMDRWTTAGKWMAQRRRLRGAARFWADHGKDSAAFLDPGELLDEADGYLDLTPQERAFVEGSKTAGMEKRTKRWKFIGAVAGIGVVALLVALFVTLDGKRRSDLKYQDARLKYSQADQAHNDAMAKLARANNDFSKARSERDEAQKQRITTEENLRLSERNLQEAAAARDDAISFARVKEAEVAKLNERQDRLTQELDDILANSSFPLDLRRKVVNFRDKLVADNQAPQAYPQKPVTQDAIQPVLQPGSGIMVSLGENSTLVGTAGVFLKKSNDNQDYLMMPGMFLSGRSSNDVFSIRSLTDSIDSATRAFQTPDDPSYEKAAPMELFSVPIQNPAPSLVARNITANGVTIRGVAFPSEVQVGTKITLIGLGSGVKQGEIIDYNIEEGLFRTTRISTLGDAGAPVITNDNKFVGILLGRDPNSEDRSIVVAAQPFLARNRFVLAGDDSSLPATTKWTEAMGEILVSGDSPEFAEKAGKFVTLLTAEGIHMPVPAAQPRKRVPSKTEIRYFRKSDKDLAEQFRLLLRDSAGVKENKMRLSFVDDPTAPPKFIQISMAKDLLIPPGAKPLPR